MSGDDDNRDYFLKEMLPQVALADAMSLGADKAFDRAPRAHWKAD